MKIQKTLGIILTILGFGSVIFQIIHEMAELDWYPFDGFGMAAFFTMSLGITLLVIKRKKVTWTMFVLCVLYSAIVICLHYIKSIVKVERMIKMATVNVDQEKLKRFGQLLTLYDTKTISTVLKEMDEDGGGYVNYLVYKQIKAGYLDMNEAERDVLGESGLLKQTFIEESRREGQSLREAFEAYLKYAYEEVDAFNAMEGEKQEALKIATLAELEKPNLVFWDWTKTK